MIEQGSHHELLNNPDDGEYSYKNLCEAQALSMGGGSNPEAAPEAAPEAVMHLSDSEIDAKIQDKVAKQESLPTEKGPASQIEKGSSKSANDSNGDGDKTEVSNAEEGSEASQNSNPCANPIWSYNKPEMPMFGIGLFLSLLSGAAWPIFSFIVTVVLDLYYSCSDLTARLLLDENNTCAVDFAKTKFTVNDTAHLYGKCQTFNDMKFSRQSCGTNLENLDISNSQCNDEIRTLINWWCLGFVIVGVACGLAEAFSIMIFSYMGEHLTKRLREQSLKSILRQNIGWFDESDNATGALTTQLATDAGLVESTMGRRMGKMVDQGCSLVVALTIAFIYSWQLTIVMLLSCVVMYLGMSLHTMVGWYGSVD